MPSNSTELVAAILAHAAISKQNVAPEDAVKDVIRTYRRFLRVVAQDQAKLQNVEPTSADSKLGLAKASPKIGAQGKRGAWFGG